MVNKYKNTIEAVASVLVVNQENKILLIKSHKWGNYYLVPGGHIEINEGIMNAAKREGEEETGLKLKPLYCVNIGELINDASFYREAHLIYFHIVCEPLSEKINLQKDELREFIWIDPREALKLNLTRGVKQTIKNFINGVRINITSHTSKKWLSTARK
ncbi:MAG: NUDIX domain-containing protein [bacterium]|nr:NUDIX domain-containing protein [bacterium]